MSDISKWTLLDIRDPLKQSKVILHLRAVRCKYYSPHSFSLLTNKLNKQVFRSQLTLFHNNVCSLKSNLENLQTHLLNELDFHFNIIGVTETRITNSNFIDFNPNITGYNFQYVPTPLSAGGVFKTFFSLCRALT